MNDDTMYTDYGPSLMNVITKWRIIRTIPRLPRITFQILSLKRDEILDKLVLQWSEVIFVLVWINVFFFSERLKILKSSIHAAPSRIDNRTWIVLFRIPLYTVSEEWWKRLSEQNRTWQYLYYFFTYFPG